MGTTTKSKKTPAGGRGDVNARLRALPRVDDVLDAMARIEDSDDARPTSALPDSAPAEAARDAVAAMRERVLAGDAPDTSAESAARDALASLRRLARRSLRRVVNATGVVVHTNLGRSPLAPAALAAVVEAAQGYSTLEYSTERLARGSRHEHCERLICALTGAEAAMAVNNNAAAALMVLSEFCAGRQAIVSRGELVEIGGSFRIPDIMATSGAHMVEVGTTNKTHLDDYRRAIGPDTGLIVKVHTSNYRIVGFSESVPARELAALAADENARREARCQAQGDDAGPMGEGGPSETADRVLVYEDLGSGSIVPPVLAAPDAEPTVREALSGGCDLVSFSGDKLLGGPQAGIIVGGKEHIERLKRNPLARAMRLDKMTLAALEATLRLYLDGTAYEAVPTLRMLNEPPVVLAARAEALAAAIEERVGSEEVRASVVAATERAGGGSLPQLDIPGAAVRLDFLLGSAAACEAHMARREGVPVIARMHKEGILLDMRCLRGGDDAAIVDAVEEYVLELRG